MHVQPWCMLFTPTAQKVCALVRTVAQHKPTEGRAHAPPLFRLVVSVAHAALGVDSSLHLSKLGPQHLAVPQLCGGPPPLTARATHTHTHTHTHSHLRAHKGQSATVSLQRKYCLSHSQIAQSLTHCSAFRSLHPRQRLLFLVVHCQTVHTVTYPGVSGIELGSCSGGCAKRV
jgi:hypothetical protein